MTTKSESRRLFGRGFYLTDEFMDVAKGHYLPDERRWADPTASPLLGEIPAGLAPAYVVTAGFDPLRDEGEAYARKLADAGVEVELRRFPDQIHGFINMVGAGRTARAASAEVAGRLGAGLGVGLGAVSRRAPARPRRAPLRRTTASRPDAPPAAGRPRRCRDAPRTGCRP